MVAGPKGRKLQLQGREMGVRELRAWVAAAPREDETWCGRQEEKVKAQRAHWLAPHHGGPGIQLLSRLKQANHSPWLQIRWFGNGLVEADSAHEPVSVLNTLALEKHQRGEIYAETRIRDGEVLGLGEPA